VTLVSPQLRHAHVFPRAAREHYVEPLWVSRRLFEVEDFGPPGSDLHDYACGWGRILRYAADAGYSVAGFDICDTRKIEELQLSDIPFGVRDFLKPVCDYQQAGFDRQQSTVRPYRSILSACTGNRRIQSRDAVPIAAPTSSALVTGAAAENSPPAFAASVAAARIVS
jgi:hypothetical protein